MSLAPSDTNALRRARGALILFAIVCPIVVLAALFERMGDHAILYSEMNGRKTAEALLVASGVALLFLSMRWLGAAILRGLFRQKTVDGYDAVGLGMATWIAGAFLFVLFRLPMGLLTSVLLALSGAWGLAEYRRQEIPALRAPQGWGSFALGAALILFLTPLLIAALTPPCEWDELVYHLTIPKAYLRDGFCDRPYLFFFHMPQNINLLYAPLLALLPDCAPRVAHFALGLLCAGAIGRLARDMFGRGSGLVAGVAFLGLPVVSVEMSAAYVDLGLTFFFVQAVRAWLRHRESQRRADLAIAAVMTGLAMGVKYTAVYGAVALAAVWFCEALLDSWRQRASFAKEATRFAGFTALAALILAPWLIKNAIMTGNPVYPNLASLLGGKDWTPTDSRLLHEWMVSMGMGRGLDDLLKLPWRLSARGFATYDRFAGVLTPLPFVGLALLITVRRAPRALWSVLGIVTAFTLLWFLGSQQVRFLLPAIALLCAVSGGLIASLCATAAGPAPAPWVALCALALSAPFNVTPWYRLSDNVSVVFGQETRDEFLVSGRPIGVHRITRYINGELPADARILMLFENRGYYLEREYVADIFETAHIPALIDAAKSPEDLRATLRAMGITHVLTSHPHWHAAGGDYARREYPQFEKKLDAFRQKYLVELATLEWATLYEIR